MEHEHREHKHEESHTHHTTKKWHLTTPIAIVIAGALIALGLIGYGLVNRGQSVNQLAFLDTYQGTNPEESLFKEGDGDVYVVEYSDSECPFCSYFHPEITNIREEYKNKITFIYRFFPLVSIHPGAYPEARELYCVGKQKGEKVFYQFLDEVFSFKTPETPQKLSETNLRGLLTKYNVDEAAFKSCVASEESNAAVQADIDSGAAAGVSGTPKTFILVKDSQDQYKIVKTVDGAAQSKMMRPMIEQALLLAQ